MKKSNIFTVLALGVLAIGAGAAVAFNSGAETIEPAAALAEPVERAPFTFNIKLKDGYDFFGYGLGVANLHVYGGSLSSTWASDEEKGMLVKEGDGASAVYKATIDSKYFFENGKIIDNPKFEFGTGYNKENTQDAVKTVTIDYSSVVDLNVENGVTLEIGYWNGNQSLTGARWIIENANDPAKPGPNSTRLWVDRCGHWANNFVYTIHAWGNEGDGYDEYYFPDGYVNMAVKGERYLVYYDIPIEHFNKIKNYQFAIFNSIVDPTVGTADDGSRPVPQRATYLNSVVVGAEGIDTTKVIYNVKSVVDQKEIFTPTQKIAIDATAKEEHLNKVRAASLVPVFEAYRTCLDSKINGYRAVDNLIASWLGETTDDVTYSAVDGSLAEVQIIDYGYNNYNKPDYNDVMPDRINTNLLVKLDTMKQMNTNGAQGLGLLNMDQQQTITIIVITSIVAITGIALATFILSKKKRLAK